MVGKKQLFSWLMAMVLMTVAGAAFLILRFSPLTFNDEAWESHTRSSVILMKRGELPEAMQSCLEAMQLISSHHVKDMRLVKTYMLLAEIYRWQEEYDQAEDVFAAAVNSCEQFYGPVDPAMAIPLESFANFYYYNKVDYGKVALLYHRILEIVKANDPENHGDISIRANNVAQVYVAMKEWEKAEPYYRLMLEHARENAMADTATGRVDLAQYLLTSADFYKSWDKCQQAVSLAEEALDLRYELSGGDPVVNAWQDVRLDVALALDVVGGIYASCGEFARAEEAYQKSVSMIEDISGEGHPDLLNRLGGLAGVLKAQQKDDEAANCYRTILRIIEKNHLQEYPEVRPLLDACDEFMGSRQTG